MFSDVTVAGNSTGIYGVLALSLLRGRKLISGKITIPLVFVSIFLLSIVSFISCGICYEKFFKSEFFHFFSFVYGTLTSYSLLEIKHILRSGGR